AVAVPGTELFRLIRGNRLEWRAEVRADTLVQLHKGMTATVRLPQGGSITGTLRQRAPTVNPETLSGIVYVDLPAGTPLAAGQFVSGQFELAARKVSVLPVSAVVYRSGAQYVMTVTPEQRIKEVKIQTGTRRNDAVEILSGLEPGAQVALAGGAFLNEGDLVAVAVKP
uniref:efflux RND transporter periplasmic adaptor subunit n=1 Tax=Methylibium sp. TaxID=2067992 RepID=UPI00333EF28D